MSQKSNPINYLIDTALDWMEAMGQIIASEHGFMAHLNQVESGKTLTVPVRVVRD